MNIQKVLQVDDDTSTENGGGNQLAKNAAIAVFTLLWFGALAGFVFLARYDSTAGTAGDARDRWPSRSRLERGFNTCTAVVFLHPQCPCSVATVEELAKIKASCNDKLKIIAVMWQPATNSDQRFFKDTKSPLQSSLASIPNITQISDRGGSEARRFGAETSGDLALYSPSGSLLFKGGITDGRGHIGDNEGADAVIAAIKNDQYVTVKRTRVFGCSLQESTRGTNN